MWPTPTKPALIVRKLFVRFVDVENAEIWISKMMYHLSSLCKVLPMKISISVEDSFVSYWFVTIGLYLKTVPATYGGFSFDVHKSLFDCDLRTIILPSPVKMQYLQI